MVGRGRFQLREAAEPTGTNKLRAGRSRLGGSGACFAGGEGGGGRRMSRKEGKQENEPAGGAGRDEPARSFVDARGACPGAGGRDCNNRFFLVNLQIKSLIVIVMRKEFGKWLMDIAKYIATAVVLSSVFGEADTWVIYIAGAVSVLAILIIGLLLVSDRPFRIHRDNRVNSNN